VQKQPRPVKSARQPMLAASAPFHTGYAQLCARAPSSWLTPPRASVAIDGGAATARDGLRLPMKAQRLELLSRSGRTWRQRTKYYLLAALTVGVLCQPARASTYELPPNGIAMLVGNITPSTTGTFFVEFNVNLPPLDQFGALVFLALDLMASIMCSQ
jgi:hypothetical protein